MDNKRNFFNLNFFIILALIIAFVIMLWPFISPRLPYTAWVHEWRQSDVLGVARNYFRESMNFFYPRIDQRRNLTGITGMEFPLYNYILALLYVISGKVIPFYGKILSGVCSLGSIYMIYKIISFDEFNKKTPINPAVLLFCAFCSKYFFAFSFAVMPEFLAMLLSLSGFYYFIKYTKYYKNLYLIISCVLFCLGMLVRPYTAFFGIIMFLYCISKIFNNKKEFLKILISGILVLIPFVIWYGYWVPYLDNTYGIHYFFMGSSIFENIKSTTNALFFERLFFLINNIFTYPLIINVLVPVGFIMYLYNYKYKNSENHKLILSPIFLLLLAGILSIIIVVLLVGYSVVSGHKYYLAAIFPIIIIFPAIPISFCFRKIKFISKRDNILKNIFVLVSLFCIYLPLIKMRNHFIENPIPALPKWVNMKYLVQEKDTLLKNVKTTDLIVTSVKNTDSPQFLYLLDRKGWSLTLPANSKGQIKLLQPLVKKGAKFYFFAYYDKNKKIKFKMVPIKEYIKQLKNNQIPHNELNQVPFK